MGSVRAKSSRIRSVDTIEGPPGSDPDTVRVIAKLKPPASREELHGFREALQLARVIGGTRDGEGFDIQLDVARVRLDETVLALRELVDGPSPSK
jgi:hypothetical protein